MTLKVYLTAVFSFVAIISGDISAMGDAPLFSITEKELTQSIQQTPIKSPEHIKLIMRASASHLLKTAYDQYTLLWQKQPNNASTNLRRGVVAMEYWEYATKPTVNELPLNALQAGEVCNVARVCLAKAVELAPKSASANAEYGHFLFYQGDEDRGVQLLKKAEALAPNASTAYELLGAIYASPNPPYYQPKFAENELRVAMRLAPLNSYPHWTLARLYLDEQEYSKAQKELQSYLKLAPPALAQEGYVKQMQSWIARGLDKK